MLKIYQTALTGDCRYEHNCSIGTAESLDRKYWNKAKRANKRLVTKVAVLCGILPQNEVKLWNPYKAYRTDTHLIYVHSSIDHFIKVG